MTRDRLLTQIEAARILRCSVRTVARIRARGEVPSIPGRPVLIRESALDDYLRKRQCPEETAVPTSSPTPLATSRSSTTAEESLARFQRALRTRLRQRRR
ncbi:MAG: DNA-binding protein [Gammaproteobacteria bacterium PRO9]|nr:DNA-binding protein [Gammaproteobacteria bacterium PRO9]